MADGGTALDTVRQMRPGVVLVQDPSPDAAQQLRQSFPQALIVGRHFVPDGDGSLAVTCVHELIAIRN